MLNIDIPLLKLMCAYFDMSYKDLYLNLEIDSVYSLSYFYKLMKYQKPLTEEVKKTINTKINELIQTPDLIKILKMQQAL